MGPRRHRPARTDIGHLVPWSRLSRHFGPTSIRRPRIPRRNGGYERCAAPWLPTRLSAHPWERLDRPRGLSSTGGIPKFLLVRTSFPPTAHGPTVPAGPALS